MPPVAGVAVGCLAVAVLTAACVSAPAPESAGESAATDRTELSEYYGQELTWEGCGGGAECSELAVPRDYADPSKGDFTLALLRQPARKKSRGALVVNPGGPGGSGVDYARAAEQVLSRNVTEVYDVVGFDPRGVNRSDPVRCLTDSELDDWLASDGQPNDDSELAELQESATEYGRKCAEKSPDVFANVDTASVVRDMDLLRSALGEKKLNYLGKSYGTLLGALYLDEFPKQAGRLVLDGVLPPDLDSEAIGLGQAVGFDEALTGFVRDCQSKKGCPVSGDSVDAGIRKVQDFLDGLDKEPLKALPDRPLTQSLGFGSILYHLYFPDFGDWDQLAAGLTDAFSGDGSTLLRMYDERLDRGRNGKYADNSIDAFNAVTCLDRAGEKDPEVLRGRAEDWAEQAPVFGPYLAWSDLVCGNWPVGPKGAPKQVTATEQNPVLVVSNTRDPATPLAWAQSLAEDLPGARLVSRDADGHTAYSGGSSCVDTAVDEFLLDGKLPDQDVSC